MTGRSSVGKTSTGMRVSDSRQATASAATPAMIVMGRRSANTMGLKEDEFMEVSGRRFIGPPFQKHPPCRAEDRAAAAPQATHCHVLARCGVVTGWRGGFG